MEKSAKNHIKVLISQDRIKRKISSIAKQLNKRYKNKNLLVLSVLSGSVIFCSDIIRKLNVDFYLDFIRVSSYKGKVSRKKIKLLADMAADVKDKEVLVIEDIYDSGRTLYYIKDILLKKKAKTVSTCVLINKNIRKKKKVDIDYFGFNIGDKFIVGYGLDYNGKYRGLPHIGILQA